MASEDFAVLKVFINGAEIKYKASVEKNAEAGNQPVNLLEFGLAGFSPGTGSTRITVTGPIPIGGTEYEYERMHADKEYVSFQMFSGRRSFVGTGKIMTYRESQSENANSEFSLEWQGELKAPEG